jgi:hypothetical protein
MRYSYTLHKCQFLSQANSPKSRQVNMISMQISSLEALLQILALSRDASFCSCYENFVHLVEGDEEQNSRAKTDLSTRSHPCLPISSPSVPPSIVPVRLPSQIISNYIFVKAFSRPRASTGPSKANASFACCHCRCYYRCHRCSHPHSHQNLPPKSACRARSGYSPSRSALRATWDDVVPGDHVGARVVHLGLAWTSKVHRWLSLSESAVVTKRCGLRWVLRVNC